jgi:hypothetical protein
MSILEAYFWNIPFWGVGHKTPVYTRTCGSWVGATMAPEGEDHVKGQACLGCKRNSLRLEPQDERPRNELQRAMSRENLSPAR